MRLTRVLFAYVRRKHISGRLDNGKVRLERNVTANVKLAAMTQLIAEQRNLDVLSRPYLTEEEEKGHLEDMGVIQEEALRLIEERRAKSWIKHHHMESELDHLNVTKAWE